MAADISPRYLSHKSVSRSLVAVQALVPDVIRVKQWPLYQDRRVQRHSCITGADVGPVAGGLDGGSERASGTWLDSWGVVWEVATLQDRLLDYLQQGVVGALLCWLVNSLTRLTGNKRKLRSPN